MEQDNHAELIVKYFRGTLTPSEQEQLDSWLAADERNRALLESFRNRGQLSADMAFFDGIDTTADWEAVAVRAGYDTNKGRVARRRILQWSIAASIILALGLAWKWPFRQKQAALTQQQGVVIAGDVQPGGNKAVLQLANGQTVTLGTNLSDTVLEENGARVRGQQGQLVYNGTAHTKNAAAHGADMQYNILTTPKGGQYELVLADGTAVWLNASSSIRFPTQFTGKDRTVELTGEGYFEVAQQRNKPFRVLVNGMEVAVLGTHFNIMAYKGITRTTLAEGAVKIVLPGKRAWQLVPGQQALVRENNDVQIAATDIEKALAWKNGVFYFRDDEIGEILEQLSRWYDVDFKTEGTVTAKRINGNIRRQARLSQVLEMLSFVSGAKFTVNGRTVTVRF